LVFKIKFILPLTIVYKLVYSGVREYPLGGLEPKV